MHTCRHAYFCFQERLRRGPAAILMKGRSTSPNLLHPSCYGHPPSPPPHATPLAPAPPPPFRNPVAAAMPAPDWSEACIKARTGHGHSRTDWRRDNITWTRALQPDLEEVRRWRFCRAQIVRVWAPIFWWTHTFGAYILDIRIYFRHVHIF